MSFLENNQRFDDMLVQDLETSCLPCDVLKQVNPWSNAFRYLFWGIGISGLFNGFLGNLLTLIGFASLRRENPWFRRGGLFCIWRLIGFTILCLPVFDGLSSDSIVGISLAVIFNLAPFIGQPLCLACAILEVYRKNRQSPPSNLAVLLPIYAFSVSLFAVITTVLDQIRTEHSGFYILYLILFLANLLLIAFLFTIIQGLHDTAADLDSTSYELTPAPLPLPAQQIILLGILFMAGMTAIEIFL